MAAGPLRAAVPGGRGLPPPRRPAASGQGNSGRFRSDDRVWQDGGLLLHFPGASRWAAIFLAFQSPAWHTDDRTGDAIETAPARPAGGEEPARIVAALVNPDGPAPERETVTPINTPPDPIDLQGRHLADRPGRSRPGPPWWCRSAKRCSRATTAARSP
ncbi:DUF2278 family protein [Nonomuraea sp. NPDC049625]|uniref:DUF2278 family protein n=1 Tax=Nonomuraea sp. NPDC049625 TaxID=3155775 RepID=UPI0034293ACC